MSDAPEYDEVVTDSGLIAAFTPPEVPDHPECLTYTDAPGVDHLCESTHGIHRCRRHWGSQTHLTPGDASGEWVSICWCACDIEWETT